MSENPELQEITEAESCNGIVDPKREEEQGLYYSIHARAAHHNLIAISPVEIKDLAKWNKTTIKKITPILKRLQESGFVELTPTSVRLLK